MTQTPTEHPYYAVFAGGIDQATIRNLCVQIGAVHSKGFNHLHLLWQSNGGGVGEGVFLYGFFRHLPLKLTLYNGGTVASAAAIAFLGAESRITSAHATFMFHRPYATPQQASASNLQRMANSLLLDDLRTEAIMRERCALSKPQWALHRHNDLWLSADNALAANVATAKGDFSPPLGTVLSFF